MSGTAISARLVHPLASYLLARKPEGMPYPDAAQLCLRLFCTVDGVPDQLQPLTKVTLGDAFSQLSRAGWVQEGKVGHTVLYGVNFHQLTDRGHWLEVIASLFKKGPEVMDPEEGERVAQEVGFGGPAKAG